MVAASFAKRSNDRPAAPIGVAPDMQQILADVQAAIAPVWSLKDFVAVNPFGGLADHDFLRVHCLMHRQRNAELLMPCDYFQESLSRGDLSEHDLEVALSECRSAHPEIYRSLSVSELVTRLRRYSPNQTIPKAEVGAPTFAASIDQLAGTSWSASIVAEISKVCAAHFDETQAAWPSPWKHLGLYAAWREIACRDRRMEKLGLVGFREFVSQLPKSPVKAIERLLLQLEVSPSRWDEFLLSQLWSINGWAAFVKYRVRTSLMTGVQDEDLVGLLALRLAYDAALCEAYPTQSATRDSRTLLNSGVDTGIDDASIRYFFQSATEVAFRRSLCRQLRDSRSQPVTRAARPEVQMVFCIDVRSEPIRRRLESLAKNLETFGYAGFFGVPMEYVPLGASHGPYQCPALISPCVVIKEGICGGHGQIDAAISVKRRNLRLTRKVWKAFQSSATSCFSFVEAVGLAYVGKLVAAGAGWRSSNGDGRYDGVPVTDRNALGPVIDGQSREAPENLVDFAAGMLGAMGWKTHFAPLVVVCGHKSDTTNNLYKASLDCGACGGHSGEANARAAVAVLNDVRVRRSLAVRGIAIPADAFFVAAVHNTTTDEILWLNSDKIPPTHTAALNALRYTATKASQKVQAERSQRFGMRGDARRRARDWSEVRPEWGLAGNAAFVIAPRSSTAAIDLKGRVFLHSYDHDQDAELHSLESIMTGPVVVTNWINMQYYASTVDNRAFGSGNKTIHNAVGDLGVVEGNGGDLMTGLAWQSVHDGRRLQHEPLRLLVIIQAPRKSVETVIAKHETLRALASNQWITLLAWERGDFFRFDSVGQWRLYTP